MTDGELEVIRDMVSYIRSTPNVMYLPHNLLEFARLAEAAVDEIERLRTELYDDLPDPQTDSGLTGSGY